MKTTRHTMGGLLRQSAFSRLAGYEDTNDADRTSVDPAIRHVVGGRAKTKQAESTSQNERLSSGRFEPHHGPETTRSPVHPAGEVHADVGAGDRIVRKADGGRRPKTIREIPSKTPGPAGETCDSCRMDVTSRTLRCICLLRKDFCAFRSLVTFRPLRPPICRSLPLQLGRAIDTMQVVARSGRTMRMIVHCVDLNHTKSGDRFKRSEVRMLSPQERGGKPKDKQKPRRNQVG